MPWMKLDAHVYYGQEEYDESRAPDAVVEGATDRGGRYLLRIPAGPDDAGPVGILLTGKPSVAGIGMLAHSRQGAFLKWGRVRKVKYKPRQQTILLKGGFSECIALFCTRDNYSQIERKIMLQTKSCQ
ncbi:MAG: hypothetical protein ACOYJC_09830 [Christensenellales bacterium]|jgi:hypothetical protein